MDLSKATKLQRVMFRCKSLEIGWITATLRTITSQHQDFQQACLNFCDVCDLAELDPGMGWPDLDRLLVQVWESRSIRAKLEYTEFQRRAGGLMDLVVRLLPESMKRGTINLVELEPISC